MSLSPVEIRHVKLGKGLFGYRRGATDQLHEEIVESFEEVWRERADLRDKLERMESDIARYRDLETLLRKTLVSAERSAQELKDGARREADVFLTEAHAEARLITRQARSERETLAAEARRVRLLLHAALDALDEAGAEELELEAAPDPATEDAPETRAA